MNLTNLPRMNRSVNTGQVVLKANAGKHRIFLLSIIGEVEGHEQSPGNVKTTKYEHVLPQLAMAEDSC